MKPLTIRSWQDLEECQGVHEMTLRVYQHNRSARENGVRTALATIREARFFKHPADGRSANRQIEPWMGKKRP